MRVLDISVFKLNNTDYLKVDDWITLRSNPRIPQLVENLKQCLDHLLNDKVRNPGPTNWDASTLEGQIMQTIVNYFLNEAPPIFHIPTYLHKQPQRGRGGFGRGQIHDGRGRGQNYYERGPEDYGMDQGGYGRSQGDYGRGRGGRGSRGFGGVERGRGSNANWQQRCSWNRLSRLLILPPIIQFPLNHNYKAVAFMPYINEYFVTISASFLFCDSGARNDGECDWFSPSRIDLS
ncbi:hypothetical protein ACTXT7_004993 [Hymenolepis weldensis]